MTDTPESSPTSTEDQLALAIKALRSLKRGLNTARQSNSHEALEYLPILQGEVNLALHKLGAHEWQNGTPEAMLPSIHN